MADFLFDGENKVITEPAGSGDTVYDVGNDIYSAWKRWVLSGLGSGYAAAFIIEGGTPIGSTGLFTGTTYILTNGWKIRPANHNHLLTLNGNIFSDDGIVTVPALTANATVFINSSVNAQGVAVSGASAEQLAAINAKLDGLLTKQDFLALG